MNFRGKNRFLRAFFTSIPAFGALSFLGACESTTRYDSLSQSYGRAAASSQLKSAESSDADNDRDDIASMQDSAEACAILKQSELQNISSAQSDSLVGLRGRNSINLAAISSMSNDHGHFLINTGSVQAVEGDIRGNIHIYTSQMGAMNDGHGSIAIVNRTRDHACSSDSIPSITGFRGNLLICGFNVALLKDFQGRFRISGGTVGQQVEVNGNIEIQGLSSQSQMSDSDCASSGSGIKGNI